MTSSDPTHDPVNRSTGSYPTQSTGQPDPVIKSMGQPGQGSIGSDLTRSTVNWVTGQPDPVNGSMGQPGHRSTGSNPTRSTQPRPLPRAATRLPTRRTFWWRVRARGWVFFGDFDTYRFVLKLSTIWYIDLAYLKLLQT